MPQQNRSERNEYGQELRKGQKYTVVADTLPAVDFQKCDADGNLIEKLTERTISKGAVVTCDRRSESTQTIWFRQELGVNEETGQAEYLYFRVAPGMDQACLKEA